jgi:hypothetical protein
MDRDGSVCTPHSYCPASRTAHHHAFKDGLTANSSLLGQER